MPKPQNVVIILSDQHARGVTGCYGNPHAETPNIDALARRGTLFARAYCNAPLCVPSRASLATGLPVHEIPAWDNADPYHGQRTSFMHRARQAGADTVSIGKLHFRSSDDDNGFDEEILPMHVVGGKGTMTSLLRDDIPRITSVSALTRNAGPGISSYTEYDRSIRDAAVAWLEARARAETDKPFLLFVSFTNPHPPYQAPEALFRHFMEKNLPLPEDHGIGRRPEHPGLAGFRRYFDLDEPFTHEVLAAATAAYYANVTATDQRIGDVLGALDRAGLGATTVIYSSDHGESLGHKGLFGKCNMYEESIGIPMIAAGPGIPTGQRCETPAQLMDIYPTVVDAMSAPHVEADARRPGTSLRALANAPTAERWILSQQHSAGAPSAVFGLTDGHVKYVHNTHGTPMLFDRDADPGEAHDLAGRRDTAPFEARLRGMIDPEAVDAACKASQAERIAGAGGPDFIRARGAPGYTPAPT